VFSVGLQEIDGLDILKVFNRKMMQGESITQEEIEGVKDTFVAVGGFNVGNVIKDCVRLGTARWEGEGDNRRLVPGNRSEQPT
jgi:hypothetical protein